MSTIFDDTTQKYQPSIQDDDVNGYCQFEDAWCWLALFSNLFPSIFIFILFFRHPSTIQSTTVIASSNTLRSNTLNNNVNITADQDSKSKEIILPCIFSFGSKIMLCCLCSIQSLLQVVESLILSHSSGWTVSLQTNIANCIWIMFVFILLRRDRKQAKATQPPTQAAVALLSLSQAATIILMKISPSVTLSQILFIPSCFQLFLFLFLLVFLLLKPADFMLITARKISFSIKKQKTIQNDSINPFTSGSESPINQTAKDLEKAQTTQNTNNRTNSQNKLTRFIDDTAVGNQKFNLNENLILAADLGSYNENSQPLGLKDQTATMQQKNLMNQPMNTQKMMLKEQNPSSDAQNMQQQQQQQQHFAGSSCILLQNTPSQQQQLKKPNLNLRINTNNSKDLDPQKFQQTSPSNEKPLKHYFKKLSHQSSSSNTRFSGTLPQHRSSSALLPSREVPLQINQSAHTTEHLQYSAYPGLCISSFFREERFSKRTVLFTVEYISTKTSKKITVLRSYREFSDLRKSLEAQCSDLTFAQFPNKLQKQQLSQNDLIERAGLFQEYLRSVVAQLNPPLPILVSFLSPSKDIFSSKSSKKCLFTKLMPEAILEDSNDCSCSASQQSHKLEQ